MNNERFQNVEDIQRTARAFWESKILLTAVELDVFTLAGEKGIGSAEAARKTSADPRGMDRLLNALVAIGLLGKSGDVFLNSKASARWLSRDSEEYQSGLMHSNALFKPWSYLSSAVRHGGRPELPDFAEDAEWKEGAFIEAMHARARHTASQMVAHINVSNASRVLDVGGGSGAYSMAFVRAKEGLRATVLDLPSVVELTKEYVRREGLEKHFDFIPGNFHETDFGHGYDIVFISAIIHMNSPEENRRMIKRATAALRPGGQLVVVDFYVDDDRTQPPWAALFALNMLVNTEGGDTYTEKEVRSWFEEAGLTKVERGPGVGNAEMMTGIKSA